MFEALYDAISFLWSNRWPTVEGEITAVEVDRIAGRRNDHFRLAVAYKFFLGGDGPYTGVSFWDPPRSRDEGRATAAIFFFMLVSECWCATAQTIRA